MKSENEHSFPSELLFTVTPDRAAGFLQCVQRGIIIRAEVGCSLRSFLRNQLQLSSQFIENRIQTIFLNGKPVDDIDAATVKNGCTLALSSAMPGLVGATMRREGFYASLRSQISHGPEEGGMLRESGFITLKLFNMVASELGPALLENGICVTKEDLGDFIRTHEAILGTWDMKAELEGEPLDGETLRAMQWADKLVRVRLKIQQKDTG